VERLAKRMGYEETIVSQMILAVDEACTNVIRHAYGNSPDQRIVLTFHVKEDRLEIHVRDFGTPPDPERLRPRDLRELRPGGLGLHFIRKSMDEVHFEEARGGGGLLRLIKYRSPQTEGGK
jgi:anti-sigma regulatory factor (Ser/Thr protein kinase)